MAAAAVLLISFFIGLLGIMVFFDLNFTCVDWFDSSNLPPVEEGHQTADIRLQLHDGGEYSEIDLSGLEGYNITSLDISNSNITGVCSGKTLEYLQARNTTGDLSKLISTAENISEASVPAEFADMIPASAPLTSLSICDDPSNPKLTKEMLASIINKHSDLRTLELIGTSINDLSPLYQSQITNLTINDSADYNFYCDWSGWYCDNLDKLFYGNQTRGDSLLSQILHIPKLSHVLLQGLNITDLTPLKTHDMSMKTIHIDSSWITPQYKNNKEIISSNANTLIVSGFLSVNTNYRSYDSYNHTIYNGNNVNITAQAAASRRYCNDGDPITFTLTVTNNGNKPVDITAYNDNSSALIVSDNDKSFSVLGLEPGETVKKYITLKTSYGKWGATSFHSYIDVNGKIVGTVLYPHVYKNNDINLTEPPSLIYGEKLNLRGFHGYNIRTVEIIAPDGEVLATLDDCIEKGYFNVDLDIPEKYCPSETEETKSMTLKAVATDTDGKTSSSSVTFDIIRYNDNNSFYVEDCHYLSYGTGTYFDRETAAIMYSGNRMIVRAKFGGVVPEDVNSAVVKVNKKSYNMVRYTSGKYKDYFGVLVDGITDSDKFEITLNASTTSGLTIDRLIGFGRILIDPSGIITDPKGEPIEGVKVTLERFDEDSETWVKWDAENYMQCNPVYTNEIGYYGWDVIEGTYRIIAEKEGYKTKTVEEYFSRDQGENTAITVLPARFDVDFSMEYEDPENPPVNTMKLDDAKDTLNSLDIVLPNDTEESDVIEKLSASLSDNIYIAFKENTYTKTASTETSQGSITGTLLVENTATDEIEEIDINIPLEKTNNEPEPSTSASPEPSPSASPEPSPSASPEPSPSVSPEPSPSASPEQSPSASPSASPEPSPSTSPDQTPLPDDNTIPATGEFANKLLIEKAYSENGTVTLTISSKDDVLPQLKLYSAIYNEDRTLVSVSTVDGEIKDNKFIITFAEPSTDKSYKIMLWTDNQTPVIKAISSMDKFFETE